MSLDLLGEGFELHGGGQDLMFPHHENERAQAVADGKEFARHWMHNGWVTVGGEKMSKSLGNFTSLADLLERSDARAYRVLVLRSHYRSPIEVTPDTIAQAEAGPGPARRAGPAVRPGRPAGRRAADRAGLARTGDSTPPPWRAFVSAMDDDLDTPGALATVFDLARRANGAADAGDADGAARAGPYGRPSWPRRSALRLVAGTGDGVDEATAALVAGPRRGPGGAGLVAAADALRDELEAAGWLVEDGAGGHPYPPALTGRVGMVVNGR